MKPSLALVIIMFFSQYSSQIYCQTDEEFRSRLKPSYCFSKYEVDSNGYLLQLFRVKDCKAKTDPKKVVIFSHALFDSADQWIMNDQNSIAFQLIDRGYDAFFVNYRGNKYSCKHKRLDPKSREFWDYSFMEMGEQDLKAVVQFVLAETKANSVKLVGHSQGTSAAFAFLASNPQLHSKIDRYIAIAPVVFGNGTIDPNSTAFWSSLDMFTKGLRLLGINSLFSKSWNQDSTTDFIFKQFCRRFSGACDWLITRTFNKSSANIDNDLMVKYLQTFPSRSSLRTTEHLGQLKRQKTARFVKFDFGRQRNKREYGTDLPPEYDLTKINVPVFLYGGAQDLTFTTENFETLAKRLPNAQKRFREDWGHMEWFIGKDRDWFMKSVLRDIDQ